MPSEPDPPLLAPEIIDALNAAGVEYVIIGALCLAAHGVVRGTKDIDIVPEPSRENLERLAGVLAELEAEFAGLGDFRPEEFPAQPDTDGLAAGGNFVLHTRLGRLDVLQDVAGVTSYAELRARAIPYVMPGTSSPALYAGLADLIRMKSAAGRARDEMDIADLRAARGGFGDAV